MLPLHLQLIFIHISAHLLLISFSPFFPFLGLFDVTSAPLSVLGLPTSCFTSCLFIYLFLYAKAVGSSSVLPGPELKHELSLLLIQLTGDTRGLGILMLKYEFTVNCNIFFYK